MTAFIRETLIDITSGRENWRVRLVMSVPAFAVAVAVALMRF